MSKKFLTLIYGDKVHIAPKTKIVPAQQFSKLVSAEELIEQIHEEGERYKEEVTAECEILKEQAKKEGFEEGFKEWAEHVAKLESEIIAVRSDVEKTIVPVALKAAQKIVGRELETSKTAIVDIISNVLKSVAQHKKVTIYVNKTDYENVEAHRNDLKEVFESLESLSIRAREDVGVGGCIIETEAGIINAQLDHQWTILERAFSTLLKPKKEDETR